MTAWLDGKWWDFERFWAALIEKTNLFIWKNHFKCNFDHEMGNLPPIKILFQYLKIRILNWTNTPPHLSWAYWVVSGRNDATKRTAIDTSTSFCSQFIDPKNNTLGPGFSPCHVSGTRLICTSCCENAITKWQVYSHSFLSKPASHASKVGPSGIYKRFYTQL